MAINNKFIHKSGFEPGTCRDSNRNRIATQILNNYDYSSTFYKNLSSIYILDLRKWKLTFNE